MGGNCTGRIDLRREGAVAYVTLDRPSALNAMTGAMYDALGDVCDQLAEEEDVRVVVFRGAGGKAFCAGSDIGAMAAFHDADDGVAYERRMDEYLSQVVAIPVPTVAVIDGLAVGGGLNIAIACDIRVATDDARFGVPIGRTLGNCLSMRNYAALVDAFGASRAKRMLMLGDMLSAQEALDAGFLARVAARDEIDGVAAKVVETLIANAPITQRVSKAAIARLKPIAHPDGDDLIAAVYGSDDFHQAVAAFLEKRKPVWQGK